jgi:hypothetical protein
MAPSRAAVILICLTAVCVQCRVIPPADEQLLEPNPDGSFPHDRLNYKNVMSQDLIEGVTASGIPKPQQVELLVNNSVLLKPAPGSENATIPLSQVNKKAPIYKIPTANGVVKAKPVASQLVHSSSNSRPAPDKEGEVHAMQLGFDNGVLGLPFAGSQTGFGEEKELQVGVRIATPVFGSGFNFCVSESPIFAYERKIVCYWASPYAAATF